MGGEVFKEHQIIVDMLITEYPSISLIYLFGSRASNSHNVNSDWDIAILTGSELDNVQRWEQAQELAEKLNSDVDLIDLYTASTVLQKQVLDNGVLLFQRDNASDVFDMKVLSMYARLQESRTELVDSFVEGLKNAGK